LGTEVSEGDCAEFARAEEKEGGVWLERPENVEERIVELLAGGAMLGRLHGRVDLGRRGLGNRSLLCRGDLPELRRAATQLLRPDVFWMEVPALALESELAAAYGDAAKLPAGTVGEYWLTPREANAWSGRLNPKAPLPVQITTEASDPGTAALVRGFRAAVGRTPLLCAPWLNRRGQLVRDCRDARECWRQQGLDGVVAGSYVVLRKADPESVEPKRAALARRPFYGGF
ncbi:MAG: hypothetical protein OEY28_12445, partial [Nitrospira sp.]|nr:hypothetical protein [Nitrospira sp.]